MKPKPHRFFSMEALTKCCISPYEYFDKFAKKVESKDGKLPYWFRDNGAKVLGIAHLDSVQTKDPFCSLLETPIGTRIYSPTLDDRLGVYTMLFQLPAMGIKIDVLLTDGEEKGQSSAAEFITNKHYNWMFQFDRTGDDVVMYQYDDTKLRELLKAYEFKPAWGSCSDITYLEHLGIKGMNFGCGYHDYHNPWAYMDLGEYFEQLEKFFHFYFENFKTKLPHTKKEVRVYSGYGSAYTGGGYGVYNERNWANWDKQDNDHASICKCEECHKKYMKYKHKTRNHKNICGCHKCLFVFNRKTNWEFGNKIIPIGEVQTSLPLKGGLISTANGVLCPQCKKEVLLEALVGKGGCKTCNNELFDLLNDHQYKQVNQFIFGEAG